MLAERTSVAIRAWHAWSPGLETQAQWRQWASPSCGDDGADVEPPLPPLPMMLRRRTTPLGQRMISSALACGAATTGARYILASRHGEFSRLLGILQSVARDELPSPGEFSMSVHHAIAGLLSIHTGNTQGHTAIAAGSDTFGMALLEAAACIAETPATPVLLMYGDQPLPEPYAKFQSPLDAEELVVALLLTAVLADDEAIKIELAPHGDRRSTECTGCTARAFLKFYLSNAPQGHSTGERIGWKWTRHG